MGRKKEFNNPTRINGTIEKEELEALDKIRWREHLEISPIVRMAIIEYIKNHSEGNDTFKLDKWNIDPNFQAVPALFSAKEDWRKHYQDSDSKGRMGIRQKVNELIEQINNVEYNDGKVKKMKFV